MGERGGRGQGGGVVGAERSAAALQRVLAQGAGRLGLAQTGQSEGQRGRRPQGGRVVRAEHPAAALQRVLAEGPGRLCLAHQDVGRRSG